MPESKLEQKLDDFLSSHPSSTYEEWISSLHPEAKEKCLLEGLGGEIIIDQDYYSENNEHRLIWNARTGNNRTKVPMSPAGSQSSEANHDSMMIFDLLGDGEEIASPAVSPSKKVEPGEDLLSFE